MSIGKFGILSASAITTTAVSAVDSVFLTSEEYSEHLESENENLYFNSLGVGLFSNIGGEIGVSERIDETIKSLEENAQSDYSIFEHEAESTLAPNLDDSNKSVFEKSFWKHFGRN